VEKSLYCACGGYYSRLSGGGSDLIKKVPMMERLPWRFTIVDHWQRQLLHTESPVPVRGVFDHPARVENSLESLVKRKKDGSLLNPWFLSYFYVSLHSTRTERGYFPRLCDSAIATCRFAQKYYSQYIQSCGKAWHKMTKSLITCLIFSIQSRVINGHITDSIWLKNYVCEIKKCSFNSFQKKIPFLAHFRLRRLYPDPFSQPLGIGTHTVFLSFFLSLIWKTQANRCTKRMLNNHLGPKLI